MNTLEFSVDLHSAVRVVSGANSIFFADRCRGRQGGSSAGSKESIACTVTSVDNRVTATIEADLSYRTALEIADDAAFALVVTVRISDAFSLLVALLTLWAGSDQLARYQVTTQALLFLWWIAANPPDIGLLQNAVRVRRLQFSTSRDVA